MHLHRTVLPFLSPSHRPAFVTLIVYPDPLKVALVLLGIS